MILIIDNYDSFTYNLAQLVECLGYTCEVIYNDKISIDEIIKKNPDKIIISPGPGTPDDAGISQKVIKRFYKTTPILGVCLGHQCVGVIFDAKLIHASQVMHGKTSQIQHNGNKLFNGTPLPFTAARYHSLAIDKVKKPLKVTARSDDDTIMAIEHENYPLYGVQFHPESFMTKGGEQIIRNFLNE